MDASLVGDLRQFLDSQKASIQRSRTDRPFNIQPYTLALDTARDAGNPFKIPTSFRSVFVRSTTDSSVSVNLALHSDDGQAFNAAIQLKQNDAFVFPQEIAQGYLTWTAQAGKTIVLYFALEGEFHPGSLLSISAGGVNISEGTAATLTQVSLVTATSTALFAANTSRIVGSFVNDLATGLWVGPDSAVTSAAGAHKGLYVAPGASFEWRNTAALYGYQASGGTVALTVMEET